MLHLASVLLIVTVWFSGDTVALQQLDRQEECSDGAGCRFLTMGPGCDVNPVAAARDAIQLTFLSPQNQTQNLAQVMIGVFRHVQTWSALVLNLARKMAQF